MSCARKVNNLCTKYNTQCSIEPETLCAQYVDNSVCKYYQNNGVCSIHGLFCDISYTECKDYKLYAQGKNNHSDPNNIDCVTTKTSYCKYCFNARIYKPTDEELMDPFTTELTDENDYSSCSVGKSSIVSKDRRFMISSGWGKPVSIEFDEWVPGLNQWTTVGVYYPKCCPECGRRLDEYEVPKVHS